MERWLLVLTRTLHSYVRYYDLIHKVLTILQLARFWSQVIASCVNIYVKWAVDLKVRHELMYSRLHV